MLSHPQNHVEDKLPWRMALPQDGEVGLQVCAQLPFWHVSMHTTDQQAAADRRDVGFGSCMEATTHLAQT